MAEEILLTKEGFEKLKKELNELQTTGRDEIAEKIKIALSFGDLSENSEYDEAKNDQGKLENKIAELEDMLKKARIIDEDSITNDTVHAGSKVKIKEVDDDEILEYKILGETESDPDNGIISVKSPIGAGLMGHHTGEVVDIEVPSGILSFEILEISK